MDQSLLSSYDHMLALSESSDLSLSRLPLGYSHIVASISFSTMPVLLHLPLAFFLLYIAYILKDPSYI